MPIHSPAITPLDADPVRAALDAAQALDVLPPELADELAAAEEAERAAEEARLALLTTLGQRLEGLKEEAVGARSDIEKRWLDDLRQFYGESLLAPQSPTKEHTGTEPEYRRARDNITRPRVIATAARLGDMLFPTNDRNWDLGASPNPSVPPALRQLAQQQAEAAAAREAEETGQPPPPLTERQLASAIRAVVGERAERMRTVIDDQLQESAYADEGRDAIMDACLYGTAVLKGPFVKACQHQQYDELAGGYRVTYTEELVPRCRHVDLWNFYPQPCRDFEEAEHAFELHLLPPKQVRLLAKQPGFDPAAVNRLLGMAPNCGALAAGFFADRGRVRGSRPVNLAGRYPVWEYHGPVPRDMVQAFAEHLLAQGAVAPEQAQELLAEIDDDHLHEIECEVWFSLGVVLKCVMHPLRDDQPSIYKVFNLEPNPDEWAGFGIPYIMRDDQIGLDMVWHAIMLNSLMSSGPQLGVRKGALAPMAPGQGGYDLSCDKPKVWALNDEVADIRQALSVFTIPNVVGDLLPVYQQIKANADEHTMAPPVTQGEETQAARGTASGLAMLMNAASIITRRFAKLWDARVTTPLVSGFYRWNMEFNPDPDIKGDYTVIPKGASHLLVRDLQAQHLQYLTATLGSNENTALYIKWGKVARLNVELLNFHADDLIYSEDEAATIRALLRQQATEQPDPRMLKAQADIEHAQARRDEAAARVQIAERAQQASEEARLLSHEEALLGLEFRREEALYRLMLQLAQMEAGERERMLALVTAREREQARDARERYRTGVDARLKAEHLTAKTAAVNAQIQHERPLRMGEP